MSGKKSPDSVAAPTGKIVLVTTSFPISQDGREAAGSFVADLVEELARHVHVTVVAPGRATRRETWHNGIEVLRYAAPDRPLSTLRPWRPADLVWLPRLLQGGSEQTIRAACGGASHILALWALPSGRWARRAAHRCGLPYSVWLLGSDVWSLGRLPVLRGILGTVIREACHAYADGYELARDAAKIARRDINFLPTTRAVGAIAPAPVRREPPYRLLFLGRWHPNKGIDLLLDALEELDDSDWKSISAVEILGGGPLEPRVKSGVARLLTGGRPIELGGFCDKAAAEQAIGRADWLLIPSRIESIPVVFSDAIKLGRPVIATPVGDLPQLIGRGCGVLSRDVRSASIADAIREATRGPMTATPERLADVAATFSLSRIAANVARLASGNAL